MYCLVQNRRIIENLLFFNYISRKTVKDQEERVAIGEMKRGLAQRASDRRREPAVNLGVAEFPYHRHLLRSQGGFILPEDVK